MRVFIAQLVFRSDPYMVNKGIIHSGGVAQFRFRNVIGSNSLDDYVVCVFGLMAATCYH